MNEVAKRIILVRHGENEANEDETVLEHVPNHNIKLTKNGRRQAQVAASKIREIVSECGKRKWKVLFYVSPSSRTRETLEEMMETLAYPKDTVVGVREECRVREQDYGLVQDQKKRMEIRRGRATYGKFFYRVPGGDSGANVYDRVSAFIEGRLWKDMESKTGASDELNLIIVSHGFTILIFLMKWFNWTVAQLEALKTPGNCECRVLQLGPDGKYSLAFHHQTEELKKWGLSDEMIEDQIFRARGLKTLPDHKISDDNIGE